MDKVNTRRVCFEFFDAEVPLTPCRMARLEAPHPPLYGTEASAQPHHWQSVPLGKDLIMECALWLFKDSRRVARRVSCGEIMAKRNCRAREGRWVARSHRRDGWFH